MSCKKKAGCYIHIPFCKRRCDYCAFLSCVQDEAFRERYVSALCNEIALTAKQNGDKYLSTLYIGGGTPSVLTTEQINRIVTAVKDGFECDFSECTIECNPSDVDEAFFCSLKQIGFNRISMGVQTLRGDILALLNRRTSPDEVDKALKAASVYFDNVSVDLMLGLPELKAEDIKNAISYLTGFKCVKHVSTYCLTCEEGTALEKKVSNNAIVLPTDDRTAAQYEYAVKLLSEKGFMRYEVSNFALLGYEAKHNSSYWDRTEYFGFGAGAAAFLDGNRLKNESDILKYIELSESGKSAVCEKETLTDGDVIEEIIMLGLRTEKGVDLNALKALGYDLLSDKSDQIERLGAYLKIENDRLKILDKYALVQNYIISELI